VLIFKEIFKKETINFEKAKIIVFFYDNIIRLVVSCEKTYCHGSFSNSLNEFREISILPYYLQLVNH